MKTAVKLTTIRLDTKLADNAVKTLHAKSGLIRNSAVVLSELARGATKEAELYLVSTLARNHPILTPTEKNWIESGEI